MTFEEMMEQYRNPGENGLPETFADDLAAAHINDLSIRDAAVQERENQLAARQAEIEARDKEVLRLKAINYDLMVAAPKPGDRDDNSENDDNGETAGGIDSLFE